MPFLPQPKCPGEWWTSKLTKQIIKKHRKFTENEEIPKIQSGPKFPPKFEVGLWFSKNAKAAGVALFFPPTVSEQSSPRWHPTANNTNTWQLTFERRASTGIMVAIRVLQYNTAISIRIVWVRTPQLGSISAESQHPAHKKKQMAFRGGRQIMTRAV